MGLQQFEKEYQINILGGYTGSGKTEALHVIAKKQKPVIDLEKLASHKGSAFGGLGQPPQPSQEMFENLLARELKMTVDKMADHTRCGQRSHLSTVIFHLPSGSKMRASVLVK
jgi:tRNA 2-selenouridine synthase SelU